MSFDAFFACATRVTTHTASAFFSRCTRCAARRTGWFVDSDCSHHDACSDNAAESNLQLVLDDDDDDDDDIELVLNAAGDAAPSKPTAPRAQPGTGRLTLDLRQTSSGAAGDDGAGGGSGASAQSTAAEAAAAAKAVAAAAKKASELADAPVFKLDIDSLEDKPWRRPGIAVSDYFNYGFNEDTWRAYCQKQVQMRLENESRGKIAVYRPPGGGGRGPPMHSGGGGGGGPSSSMHGGPPSSGRGGPPMHGGAPPYGAPPPLAHAVAVPHSRVELPYRDMPRERDPRRDDRGGDDRRRHDDRRQEDSRKRRR